MVVNSGESMFITSDILVVDGYFSIKINAENINS